MKKILSKSIISLSLILFILILASCESNYVAKGLIDYSKNNELNLSFNSLEGTYVRKINNTNKNDGQIHYDIVIEKGSVDIYYKTILDPDKVLLISITSSGTYQQSFGYVDAHDDVKIYIITKEAIKGKINIKIK